VFREFFEGSPFEDLLAGKRHIETENICNAREAEWGACQE
jgi:hypothetical protein